jgi:hypothetical protein
MVRLSKVVVNLRQKPRPLFALVDPNLDQTGGGDVVILVTDLMYSPLN